MFLNKIGLKHTNLIICTLRSDFNAKGQKKQIKIHLKSNTYILLLHYYIESISIP